MKKLNLDSLDGAICTFEGPIADDGFSRIARLLGEPVPAPSTEDELLRLYLLARIYELLGYCARHSPWLANHPKFYWHTAAEYFAQLNGIVGQAKARGIPTDTKAFLLGKYLLRQGQAAQAQASLGGAENLEEAKRLFKNAALAARTKKLRAVYEYEVFVTEKSIAEHRLVGEMRKVCQNYGAFEHWSTFSTLTQDLLQLKGLGEGQNQVNELDGRRRQFGLTSRACLRVRLHRMVLKSLVVMRRRCSGEPECASAIDEKIDFHESESAKIMLESANNCTELGLNVRASHATAISSLVKADVAFERCRIQFAETVMQDASRRAQVWRELGGDSVVMNQWIPQLLSEGPVADAQLQELDEKGVAVDEKSLLQRVDSYTWLITGSHGCNVINIRDEACHISTTSHASIVFDPNEGQLAYGKYEGLTNRACKHYSVAKKAIGNALKQANGVYTDFAAMIAQCPPSPDLNRLLDEVESVKLELAGERYPLLDNIERRTLYLWTLLEMFQVRNGTIRMGTLMTGRCQIILRDPYEEELREVGSDPLLRNALGLIFTGAKGERDLYTSLNRLLRTVNRTIQVQRIRLRSELRFIDPQLSGATSKAFCRRLDCHEQLVNALSAFVPILGMGAPDQMKMRAAIEKAEEMNRFLEQAAETLKQVGDHGSPLVDHEAIEAIREFTNGVAESAIGMAAHYEGNDWMRYYAASQRSLENCAAILEQPSEAYLFAESDLRETWLRYVEARAATVSGWAQWNGAEESKDPEGGKRAATDFRKAQALFEKTGDYRGATKSSARALEIEARAHLRTDESSFVNQERGLNKARALYAACGDKYGYDRVCTLLSLGGLPVRVTWNPDLAGPPQGDYQALLRMTLAQRKQLMFEMLAATPELGFDQEPFERQREGQAAEIRLHHFYFGEHLREFSRLKTRIKCKEEFTPGDRELYGLFTVERTVAEATGIDRNAVKRSQLYRVACQLLGKPSRRRMTGGDLHSDGEAGPF